MWTLLGLASTRVLEYPFTALLKMCPRFECIFEKETLDPLALVKLVEKLSEGTTLIRGAT